MSTTTQRPATLAVNVVGLPADPLFALYQWVTWDWSAKRPGEWTKPPFRPLDGKHASHSKRDDWGSRAEALAAMRQRGHAGIGFVLTHDLGMVGLDFDHCRNAETGELAGWAAAWVARFASFAEATPSGTGIRIFVKGTLPTHIPEGGTKRDGREVYAGKRFLTLTGHRLPGVPATVEPRQEALDAFLAEYFPAPAPQAPRPAPAPVNLDDAALIAVGCRWNDGGKFDRLYHGNLSDVGGDESAGDYRLALACAALCHGDTGRIERIMRASGLVREKWDTRRGQATWLGYTIAKACGAQTWFYDPLRPHRAPLTTPKGEAEESVASPPITGDDPLVAYLAMSHEALARLAVELAGAVVERDGIIAEVQRRAQRTQKTLTSVLAAKRNPATKAERDTVIACAFDVKAEIAAGHVDDEGWIRQPLARVAEAAGKGKRAVAEHLERAEQWGLLERKLVTEEPIREVDTETGEVRERPTGAYYVRLKDDPEKIVDILVTLTPPKVTKKDGTPKAEWGGKREPCATCGGTETRRKVETARVTITTLSCAGCGAVHAETISEPTDRKTVETSYPAEGRDIPTAVDPALLLRLRGKHAAGEAPPPTIVPDTSGPYPASQTTYTVGDSDPDPVPADPINSTKRDTLRGRARGAPPDPPLTADEGAWRAYRAAYAVYRGAWAQGGGG